MLREWSDEERLGVTPELLALSDSTCDCAALEDGGQGHDPDCAFYLAVAHEIGWDHPLVVAVYGPARATASENRMTDDGNM